MRLPSAGAFVALAIALVVAGGFAALFSAAGEPATLGSIGPYLTRILGFSLAQATVSTLASLVLGAALALGGAVLPWIVGEAAVVPLTGGLLVGTIAIAVRGTRYANRLLAARRAAA